MEHQRFKMGLRIAGLVGMVRVILLLVTGSPTASQLTPSFFSALMLLGTTLISGEQWPTPLVSSLSFFARSFFMASCLWYVSTRPAVVGAINNVTTLEGYFQTLSMIEPVVMIYVLGMNWQSLGLITFMTLQFLLDAANSGLPLQRVTDLVVLQLSAWIICTAICFDFYRTEQQRLKELSQALDAKLNAKSDFIAQLSHDLRTPLVGMFGYLEQLQKEPRLSERGQEACAVIGHCAKATKCLIDGLLDFRRGEQNKLRLRLEPFNLAEHFNSLVRTLTIAADQKDITLSSNSDLPNVEVLGDSIRLEEIVWNLVTNAIKFSPQRSVVRLTGSCSLEEDRGLAHVVLTVSDQGPGIPPEFRDRIFEPYVQLHPNDPHQNGLGLGLATCRLLVKLMDGELQLTSAVGSGTSFRLSVALAMHKPSPAARADLPTPHGRKTKVIMVADDNALNRRIAVKWLEEAGYATKVAMNGQEAVDRADESLSLILMDLQMPVLDGYMAARQIRARYPGLPVVALTASTESSSHQAALTAGMTAVLLKPIPKAELLHLVHTLAS